MSAWDAGKVCDALAASNASKQAPAGSRLLMNWAMQKATTRHASPLSTDRANRSAIEGGSKQGTIGADDLRIFVPGWWVCLALYESERSIAYWGKALPFNSTSVSGARAR